MVKHLCYLSDNSENKKKLRAVLELIEARDSKSAKYFEDKLGLKSRQVARLLKRIDCIDREKEYNRYRYSVNVNPPQKFDVAGSRIEIEDEEDGKLVIKLDDEEVDRR